MMNDFLFLIVNNLSGCYYKSVVFYEEEILLLYILCIFIIRKGLVNNKSSKYITNFIVLVSFYFIVKRVI